MYNAIAEDRRPVALGVARFMYKLRWPNDAVAMPADEDYREARMCLAMMEFIRTNPDYAVDPRTTRPGRAGYTNDQIFLEMITGFLNAVDRWDRRFIKREPAPATT